MKTKKFIIIAVIAIAVIIGWLVVVRAVTKPDDAEVAAANEAMLEAQADGYLERKLYIRAIPAYQEAAALETDRKAAVQAKLLNAYELTDNMAGYTDLVIDRVNAGVVVLGECMKAAEYEYRSSGTASAITLLRNAMEKIAEDESRASDRLAMSDYIESIRYGHTVTELGCKQVITTEGNNRLPAYDGEHWGYIDGSGNVRVPYVYDYASAYNEDWKAVVKLHGRYYTIDDSGNWYGADDGTASPVPLEDVRYLTGTRIIGKKNGKYSFYDLDYNALSPDLNFDLITPYSCGYYAVEDNDLWGFVNAGMQTALPCMYEDIALNSVDAAFAGDRAMVLYEGAWRMIDTGNNYVGSNTYRDARAPESEGYIAVSDASGKWGFADPATGQVVIDCKYDDAYSYSCHLAAVKLGGKWGYLSERGELVIKPTLDDAKPLHNGRAVVRVGDAVGMLEMEFKE